MINELDKLVRLVEREDCLRKRIRVSSVLTIENKNQKYPIYSYSIGSQNPQSPVLFITGGIHGVERIGAQLAWSLLKTTVDRMIWDKALRDLLQYVRLVVTHF